MIFFQIVILAYIVAVIMTFFPAKMSTAQEAEAEHKKGMSFKTVLNIKEQLTWG